MNKPYHIVTRAARESAAVIEEFCQTNGQILLPIVNLIQNASEVVESVIYEIGHQTLEQILVLSAEQVAGSRTPGKASGDIRQRACDCPYMGPTLTIAFRIQLPYIGIGSRPGGAAGKDTPAIPKAA